MMNYPVPWRGDIFSGFESQELVVDVLVVLIVVVLVVALVLVVFVVVLVLVVLVVVLVLLVFVVVLVLLVLVVEEVGLVVGVIVDAVDIVIGGVAACSRVTQVQNPVINHS
jgi:hypothetical protein